MPKIILTEEQKINRELSLEKMKFVFQRVVEEFNHVMDMRREYPLILKNPAQQKQITLVTMFRLVNAHNILQEYFDKISEIITTEEFTKFSEERKTPTIEIKPEDFKYFDVDENGEKLDDFNSKHPRCSNRLLNDYKKVYGETRLEETLNKLYNK